MSVSRSATRIFAGSLLLASAALSWHSCSNGGAEADSDTHAPSYPDTLRVATLYSPGSYFLYRDQPMGYDYSLIRRFADDKDLPMKLTVAPSISRAIEMLDSGLVDIVAYEIPQIAEYRDIVLPCGPVSEAHQVLVQPKHKGKRLINDVTDLPGHQVTVEGNTKYLFRLNNLNDELGGGIEIDVVDNDSITTEDLIDMVAKGVVPLTVADNYLAMVSSTYYPTLDVSLALSFPQSSSWGVSHSNSWLADSIDAWLSTDITRSADIELHRRYFEAMRDPSAASSLDLKGGKISIFDDIFKTHARQIGWDWRLLAAMSYKECRFDPSLVSWAGAKGLMQLMPGTAKAYGLAPDEISDPDKSVAAAARLLADLDSKFAAKIPDTHERTKFVLAAYNAGIGHIYDAVALAAKYGLDPCKWDNNVERALLLKANPEYYNDPVVKNGYMHGRETVAYVTEVLNLYSRFASAIPLGS